MTLNEFVSSHSFRYTLDIAVLFVGFIFYSIFNVPLIVHAVNDEVFLISVGSATVIFFIYLFILKFSSETAFVYNKKSQAIAIVIPLVVTFLYFSNLLPAVPLSLKNAGIYHNVYRDPSTKEYILEHEETVAFPLFQTRTFHSTPTDSSVFFYTAVHAPTDITAPVSHVWEWYDEISKSWITQVTIPFSLSGGRSEGYRAYSNIDSPKPGLWRVTVRVGQNRIIGRLTFEVIKDM
jgi:hypothetical protein